MQGAFLYDDAAKCVVYVLNGCKKRNYRELERQKCAHCRAGTEGGTEVRYHRRAAPAVRGDDSDDARGRARLGPVD